MGYGVQSSAWQIRLPATEQILINDFSQTSSICTILKVLNCILDEIIDDHRKHQVHKLYMVLVNDETALGIHEALSLAKLKPQ